MVGMAIQVVEFSNGGEIFFPYMWMGFKV